MRILMVNPNPRPAAALEMLLKAEGPKGDGEFIWSPHESPLVREIIERFTKKGLSMLGNVKDALMRWQNKHDKADAVFMPPTPAIGNMTRWTEEEKELVRIYLEALPKAAWELGDHMLAVELVVQTYLPEDELLTQADWLATKATLMGKVQNNLKKKPTLDEANKILDGLPESSYQTVYTPLSPKERTTMDFAVARAAENVVNLAENTRQQMRGLVARHVEKQVNGDVSGPSLQSELFDTFATLNRDWRRIAVTEAGEAQLQGMIAGCKPGDKVKRIEQYPSACKFCKKIHGTIATVVEASHPNKDPDTMIWPGKNNIGRAMAPRKRIGGQLVKRTPEEMYWLPAGLAHPHCRGRWVPVVDAGDVQDPEFAAILQEFLQS